MSSFAIFRLPRKTACTLMVQKDGEPEELCSYARLNGRSGFVVAPFSISPATPLLLLRPDYMESFAAADSGVRALRELLGDSTAGMPECGRSGADRETYAEDFAAFHSRLLSGEFRKIVLSRCSRETTAVETGPAEMFGRACRMYPRMFVALFSTPRSGTWLMATPEILLEGGGGRWSTIALAGTMRLEGGALDRFDMPVSSRAGHPVNSRAGHHEPGTLPEWSGKNMEEQQYVAAYIKDCLARFTAEVSADGPYTVRAGNLVHLRSDFRFALDDDSRIGDLISVLHPTPAVCGLPKGKAYGFISAREHTPRAYYSGFTGPLGIGGETRLYVSLRCMRLNGTSCDLYAGGGLLKDSTEQQEWDETEAKMETMRRILSCGL